MFLDSYDKAARREEIEKLINQADQLSNQAIEFLANNDLKSADDCHTRIQHLLEQAKSGIDELKSDLGQ
jgi:predicted translin family RNA/ssDNA-binding protein